MAGERSRLNTNTIFQSSFDEVTKTLGVRIEATELDINLDADSGDTVAVQPRISSVSVTSDVSLEMNVENCREYQVYSENSTKIEISPDGSVWIEKAASSTGLSSIITDIAKSIRVTAITPGKIVISGRG